MRTKLILIGLFFLLFLTVHGEVTAHSTGSPYILVNGEYAGANPILPYTEPAKFELGEDVATSSGYVMNEPIAFAIDEHFFPNPYGDDIEPQFQWDFGDESAKSQGESIYHSYTKPGTYIVALAVKYPGKSEDFVDANTVQVDVLPSRDYIRPTAKISVNGKTIVDPAKDMIAVRPGRSTVLDASGSTGDIVSYVWDFADDTSGNGKTVSHVYKHDAYFPLFPVLRVTDKNNIVNDTFVFLDAPINRDNILLRLLFGIEDFFIGLFRKS